MEDTRRDIRLPPEAQPQSDEFDGTAPIGRSCVDHPRINTDAVHPDERPSAKRTVAIEPTQGNHGTQNIASQADELQEQHTEERDTFQKFSY